MSQPAPAPGPSAQPAWLTLVGSAVLTVLAIVLHDHGSAMVFFILAFMGYPIAATLFARAYSGKRQPRPADRQAGISLLLSSTGILIVGNTMDVAWIALISWILAFGGFLAATHFFYRARQSS